MGYLSSIGQVNYARKVLHFRGNEHWKKKAKTIKVENKEENKERQESCFNDLYLQSISSGKSHIKATVTVD